MSETPPPMETGGPGPDNWEYDYWEELYSNVLQHPKRRVVLETVIESDAGTMSTTALATEVETRLERAPDVEDSAEYDAQNLNQVLPVFEKLGVIQRIPKWERDDQYVILPVGALADWLASCTFQMQLLPDDLPDGYRTQLSGEYIVSAWEDISDDELEEAGSHIPMESALYTAVMPYVQHVDSISIHFEMGSLNAVRESEFELESVAEELSLGTSLPEPDGDFSDRTDYGIFADISGFTGVYDVDDLRRRLQQQLGTWLASAEETYDQFHKKDADAPSVAASQLADATQDIIDREAVDGAANRYGSDVTIVEPADGEPGRIMLGLYRRTA